MTIDAVVPYAAGFFDGEGCIYIRGRSGNKHLQGHLMATVQVTKPEPLYLFAQRWGGSVKHLSRKPRNYSDIYCWELGAIKAANFIRDIYPYLTIKKKVAMLGRTFHALKTRGEDSCTKGFRGYQNPVPQALYDIRNKIDAAMRVCNRRGRWDTETEVHAAA